MIHRTLADRVFNSALRFLSLGMCNSHDLWSVYGHFVFFVQHYYMLFRTLADLFFKFRLAFFVVYLEHSSSSSVIIYLFPDWLQMVIEVVQLLQYL